MVGFAEQFEPDYDVDDFDGDVECYDLEADDADDSEMPRGVVDYDWDEESEPYLRGYQKQDVIDTALIFATQDWFYGQKQFIFCEGGTGDMAEHDWTDWERVKDVEILGEPARREMRSCGVCEGEEYRAQPL